MMERFENAKIDDLVWCRKHGNGAIYDIGNSKDVYKIDVVFESKEGCQIFESYTIGGYCNKYDVEPMLFYRKGEDRYLTERPEPDVDWAAVAPGTVCFVANHNQEMESERIFLCFVDGEKWFKAPCSDHATVLHHARIK